MDVYSNSCLTFSEILIMSDRLNLQFTNIKQYVYSGIYDADLKIEKNAFMLCNTYI